MWDMDPRRGPRCATTVNAATRVLAGLFFEWAILGSNPWSPNGTTSGSFNAMTTTEIADRAGRLLAEAAPAQSKVILFGSHVRGEATDDSDFDSLVIEPLVAGKAKEMVRLRGALDPLRVAADVVVVTHDYVEEWGDVPGTMLHDALTEGRVLAET
jgi:uncharacterized protein